MIRLPKININIDYLGNKFELSIKDIDYKF